MKKILLLGMVIFASAIIYAQTPQSFNYQAVVRDATGAVIENQAVGVRLSIILGPLPGTIVYQESHNVSSNNYGIVTLAVGTGAVQNGVFSAINWGGGEFFLKVEVDPAGSTAYVDMGTT